jgi:hypothetical protein
VFVAGTTTGAIHMSKLPNDVSSVTTVAVDLAKHVFQIHATDSTGRLIVVDPGTLYETLALELP